MSYARQMGLTIRNIVFILICVGTMFSYSYGQCSYTDTLSIPDFSSEQILLDINGAINNDMQTNGICAVRVKFKHAQIGDFIIELISPSGQRITLVGPSGVFGSTEFTTWDVTFVPCNSMADPDIGFLPQWNNNQFWGIFGTYDGSYYPYNGCLEDFNQGPVDGVWTLDISDNQQFDVGDILGFELVFCDPRGIDCAECEKPTLNLEEEDMIVCLGTELLSFTPQMEIIYEDSLHADRFTPLYIIAKEDTVVSVDSLVDMRAYGVGTYILCGILAPVYGLDGFIHFLETSSYTEIRQELMSPTPGFCAAITEDCMTIEIREKPDTIFISQDICRGDTFFFKGEAFTQAGLYHRTIRPPSKCDSTFQINISEIYVASIILPPDQINCYQPEITLDARASFYSGNSTIQWSTDDGNILSETDEDTIRVNREGTYYFVIKEKMCTDTSFVTVVEDFLKPEADVKNGIFNCDNRTRRLSAEIRRPYDSLIWKGPEGFRSHAPRPRVSKDGLYTLVIRGTNGCIDSFNVLMAMDTTAPAVTALIPNVSCENELIDLDISQSYNKNYNYLWTSNMGFYAQAKDTFAQAENTTYFIKVTNEKNGCVGRDSFSIGPLIPFPYVSLSVNDTLDCYTDSLQIHNVSQPDTIGFHWSGPDGFSSKEKSPYVHKPGIYYVETESGNNCDIGDSIEVRGNFFIPDIWAEDDTIACHADTIILTATSSDEVIFEWTGPGAYRHTGPDAPVILSGQYIVRAITSGGCKDSVTVTVVDAFSQENIKLSSDTLTCTDLSAEVSFDSGVVDSFYWFSRNGEYIYDSSFVTTSSGYHYFHFIDMNGCKDVRIIRTVKDDKPPEIEYLIPDINCATDSVQIETTTEAIGFHWAGPDGFLSLQQNPWVYEVGQYRLEALGKNGCILYDTVTVKNDTITPEVNIIGHGFDCEHDSVQLSINEYKSGMRYIWSGPEGFQSQLSNPFVYTPGTYAVTVTASNDCQATGMINIDLDTIRPEISVVGDTLRCDRPTSVLYASANIDSVEYTWFYENNTRGIGDTIIAGNPGEYTLLGKGPNGCITTIVYDLVADFDVPDFSVQLDTLTCSIRTVSPQVEIDDTEIIGIQWRGPDGFFSDELEPELDIPGAYEFQFTLSNGCTAGDTYDLIEDVSLPPAQLEEGYKINCTYPILKIDSELPQKEYHITWISRGDTISNDSFVTIDTPGKITFIAEGENSCILNKMITVGMDTIVPQLSIKLDTFTCRVTKIPVEVTAASESYTYTWTYPDGDTSSAKEPTFLMPGHYTVEARDTNGCSTIRAIELHADTLAPVMNIMGGSLSCDDQSLKLRFNSASPVESVRWFGPGSFFSNEWEPRVYEVGDYRITAIAPNGCFSRDTVTVDDDPPYPTFGITKYGIDCNGDSVYVRIVPQQGNDYLYRWEQEGNVISTSQAIVLDGTLDYLLSVRDTFNGCEMDTIISFERDSIVPQIEIRQLGILMCTTNIATLTVGKTVNRDFLNYRWRVVEAGEIITDSTLSSIRIKGTGVYELLITDTRNGCQYSDSIIVKRIETTLKEMQLEVDMVSCWDLDNGRIKIHGIQGGTPPYKYAINDEHFSNRSIYDALGIGDYTLTVKDAYGCKIDTIIILEDEDILSVEIGPDTVIALGSTVKLRPKIHAADSIYLDMQWEPSGSVVCPSCASTSTTPTETTFYTFTLRDSSGCVVSDSREITIMKESKVYVPSAFTPNDDGTNDFVRPFFAEDVSYVKLFAIYERRGNAVFSVENIQEQDFNMLNWDGTVNGVPLNPQVFTYKLIFKRKDGRLFYKSGTITLLR